jgi:F0F1-type ATP synthase assembly protein I
MEDLKKTKEVGSTKNMALAISLYSSASILGPIIFFGGIGYFLDRAFGGNNKILLGGIFIAFIFTNILIFHKASSLYKNIKDIKQKDEA